MSDFNSDDGLIHGRRYKVIPATVLSRVHYRKRPKPRVIVEGLMKRDGERFIRFKSVERAGRHIMNMGLART
jgi:hypothetical protein